MSATDPFQGRAWRAYVERFLRDGLPKIRASAIAVEIMSGEGQDLDVKQATELGAILLLDKPLLLVVAPGTRVPSRLARAADVILLDWVPADHDAQPRLREAILALAEGLR